MGRYTSLALDASGRPHISYCDWTDFDLKYARFDDSFEETAWRFGKAESPGTSCQLSTVDSPRSVGEYTSLALDASGYRVGSPYETTNRPRGPAIS